MSATSHRDPRPAPPDHLDTPLCRALSAVGLFSPLRRITRRIYRLRTQRRALRGQGLVPEAALKKTYRAAVEILKDRLGPDIGDYLEFGVCHGSSMACMHDVLRDTQTTGVRKFGFDSFEGLPPEADDQDGGFFSKGQFDSSIGFTRKLLTRRGIDWNETTLVVGWFKDTCTPEMAREAHIRKVGIVMIDCDICSATREALDFSGPLLGDHAVIVFDDWNSGNLASRNMGQRRAFDDFTRANPQFSVCQLPSFYDNSAVFLLSRI